MIYRGEDTSAQCFADEKRSIYTKIGKPLALFGHKLVSKFQIAEMIEHTRRNRTTTGGT